MVSFQGIWEKKKICRHDGSLQYIPCALNFPDKHKTGGSIFTGVRQGDQ